MSIDPFSPVPPPIAWAPQGFDTRAHKMVAADPVFLCDDAQAFDVGIIGAGPAGLMAAETLAKRGVRVQVIDGSPSAGRKFLMAGRGGLNITHSEPFDRFVARYHGGGYGAEARVAQWLQAFGPEDVRAWCAGLGIETFVGTSGRVFPAEFKAAPLLRRWLHRLREQGVRFRFRTRWKGWGGDGGLRFEGAAPVPSARIWIFALGGGSWARLGSDGAWLSWLAERGVEVVPLQASNCGFVVQSPRPDGTLRIGWSDHLRERFAGQAIKNVAVTVVMADGERWTQKGELLVNESGLEGGLIYAASSRLRQQLDGGVPATLWLDLLPAIDSEKMQREVTHPRGARSWASHFKSRLGIDGVKMALLREMLPADAWAHPERVAKAVNALPIPLSAMCPMDQAISTAGGVAIDALTSALELKALPDHYCVGEMIDWDAPTGGYLLTACLSSGYWVGQHLCGRLATLAGHE